MGQSCIIVGGHNLPACCMLLQHTCPFSFYVCLFIMFVHSNKMCVFTCMHMHALILDITRSVEFRKPTFTRRKTSGHGIWHYWCGMQKAPGVSTCTLGWGSFNKVIWKKGSRDEHTKCLRIPSSALISMDVLIIILISSCQVSCYGI